MDVRERVAVVLVRARNALNIGAVARAMTDFGFVDLRVVTVYPVPFLEARSAVDAGDLLRSARVFGSVGEAVSDCGLVYGTTALGERRLEHPVEILREAAVRITVNATGFAENLTGNRTVMDGGRTENDTVATGGGAGDGLGLSLDSDVRVPGRRVAVLFGSEKTGLSNEELSHCHRLLTIPMHTAGVSMNLGQAVAVVLYELVRESGAPRALPEREVPASAGELARFEELLRSVLEEAGYEARHPGNLAEASLRRLVRRLGLPGADVAGWLGMLRQVLWKLRAPDR